MNAFFYSANTLKCNTNYRYQTCSKRCVSALREITALHKLVVLPGGLRLTTPLSMKLRSGDLVILYAENRSDLEELVEIREIFETFRVILILGEEGLVGHGACHLLNPRYITVVGRNYIELEAIVHRIFRMSDKQFRYRGRGIKQRA